MKSSVPAELVVGEVAWCNTAKNIAGVIPLVHRVNGAWQDARPTDYPPQGQLFWPKAGDYAVGSLHTFRIRPTDSPGPQKDEFVVESVDLSYPIADCREWTAAEAVRAMYAGPTIVSGVDHRTENICLLCHSDVLVGPIPVKYAGRSSVTIDKASKNLHKVPLHRHSSRIVDIDSDRALFIPAGPAGELGGGALGGRVRAVEPH